MKMERLWLGARPPRRKEKGTVACRKSVHMRNGTPLQNYCQTGFMRRYKILDIDSE
jgi:hypothetical protein